MKYTDNEIIKALECCRTIDGNDCSACPYHGKRYEIGSGGCSNHLVNDALALINRQKASIQEVITLNSKLEAENAKLQRLLDFYEETSGNKKAKAEAIKEFAERLKPKLSYYDWIYVDNLVKEMTEAENESQNT